MSKELMLTSEEGEIWDQIIDECKRNFYHSINIASEKRRAVILKVASAMKEVLETGKIGGVE